MTLTELIEKLILAKEKYGGELIINIWDGNEIFNVDKVTYHYAFPDMLNLHLEGVGFLKFDEIL
jgi:hypothetical protein